MLSIKEFLVFIVVGAISLKSCFYAKSAAMLSLPISFKTLNCKLSVRLKTSKCICRSVAGLWRWRFAQSAKSISAVQDIISLKEMLQRRGMAFGYSFCYLNDWQQFLYRPSNWLTDFLPSATKLSLTINSSNQMTNSYHDIFLFVELIVPWQATCLAILVPDLKVLLQKGTCHL